VCLLGAGELLAEERRLLLAIEVELRKMQTLEREGLNASIELEQARREHEAARRAADEIVSEAASRGGAASVRSTQRAASLTARAEARAAEILHAAELEATRILERGDRMLEQPQLS